MKYHCLLDFGHQNDMGITRVKLTLTLEVLYHLPVQLLVDPVFEDELPPHLAFYEPIFKPLKLFLQVPWWLDTRWLLSLSFIVVASAFAYITSRNFVVAENGAS